MKPEMECPAIESRFEFFRTAPCSVASARQLVQLHVKKIETAPRGRGGRCRIIGLFQRGVMCRKVTCIVSKWQFSDMLASLDGRPDARGAAGGLECLRPEHIQITSRSWTSPAAGSHSPRRTRRHLPHSSIRWPRLYCRTLRMSGFFRRSDPARTARIAEGSGICRIGPGRRWPRAA
jgi:hypothetical protein